MSRPEAAGPSRGAASASPAALPLPLRLPPRPPARAAQPAAAPPRPRDGGQSTVSGGEGRGGSAAAGKGRARAGRGQAEPGRVSADTPARPSGRPARNGAERSGPRGGGGRGAWGAPGGGCGGNFKPVEAQKRPRCRALRRVLGKVNTGRAGAVRLAIRQHSSFSSQGSVRPSSLELVWVFLVVGGFSAKWHSSVDSFFFFLKALSLIL